MTSIIAYVSVSSQPFNISSALSRMCYACISGKDTVDRFLPWPRVKRNLHVDRPAFRLPLFPGNGFRRSDWEPFPKWPAWTHRERTINLSPATCYGTCQPQDRQVAPASAPGPWRGCTNRNQKAWRGRPILSFSCGLTVYHTLARYSSSCDEQQNNVAYPR